MTKLWELSHDIEMLEEAISTIQNDPNLSDQDKESLTQDAFKQYLETDQDFEDKALKVADYIRYIEAITQARKEEARRLQALAKQSENQAQCLRNYLVTQMLATGKKKIEGVTGKLSVRKKPLVLRLLVDSDQLPQEFQKVSIEANKQAIKRYIQDHDDCSFACLEDTGEYSLTIK